MKTGYRDAFAPFVDFTSFRLSIAPMITCTGIQEHGDEEQVDQAASDLKIVTSLLVPLLHQGCDARNPADLEMLPTAMRGDCVKLVWTEVPLVIERVSDRIVNVNGGFRPEP